MQSTSPAERVAASVLVVVTGIVADFAGAATLLASSGARDWVRHHSFIIAGVTVTLLAILLVITNRLARSLNSLHGQLSEARKELTGANRRSENLEANLSIISQQLADTSLALKDEQEGHRKTKYEAETIRQRLSPTGRDKSAFSELMTLLNWQNGFIAYLDAGFTGKQWFGNDVAPLYEFVSNWREHYFDDEQTQDAFAQFWECCYGLIEWLAGEGAPTPSTPSLPDGDSVYSIASASERPGGYPEFSAERNRGLDKATALIDSRRRFERVGRERGL